MPALSENYYSLQRPALKHFNKSAAMKMPGTERANCPRYLVVFVFNESEMMLCQMVFLLNSKPVDALALIVSRGDHSLFDCR